MSNTAKQIRRLQDKVQILEEMLEERSRNDYFEAKRKECISLMLSLSMREPPLKELLDASLKILLEQDFLTIEKKGCIFLASQTNKELTLTAGRNIGPQQWQTCGTIAYGKCLCGQAIQYEKIIVERNSDQCRQFSGSDMHPHGHCCLPLIDSNGHVGVLCLYLPYDFLLSEEQKEFLVAIADILTGAIQRFHYREKIQTYQANLEKLVSQKVEELRQAESQYQDIFNNAPNGLFQVTSGGKFIDCNPALAQMLAFDSPEELMNQQTALDLYVDPLERQRLLDELAKGPVAHFIARFKRKDGHLLWAQISARFLDNDQEKIIQGSIIDISRRKEVEVALEAEKERLLVTLRSIGDGVISTDAKGKITLLNQVAEELTGWSLPDALGKPLTEVFHIINEQTRVRCVSPVEKVLASGEIVGLINHTALVSKDGIERSIADSGAPIRNLEGEIIGVVLVFRDVTEAKRLEAELQKKRQLESLGVLAGGIAHDFNNILTAILGNINLVQLQVPEGDKVKDLLKQAEQASRRAASLVQQLLTFSRGGEPIRQTASLGEIIMATADFILRGSGVSCVYDFAEDLWLADIDSGQISQVIQNLVLNAQSSMPEGGSLRIQCSNMTKKESDPLPLRNGRYLKITVQDRGSGIDKELLGQIFEPYYTTKEAGSGLGLAIVHSIVEKHDGYIGVESTLGEGTSFNLYLPASNQKLEGPAVQQEEPHKGRGRILFMDDDEMVRHVTDRMLCMLGYQTTTVGDGEEAIETYSHAQESGRPFDAVIMDLTIAGGMGGIEAVQGVLKIDPNAKVLVASGYGNDPVLANPRSFGFLGALVKPFQVDELGESLKKILSDALPS